MSKYAEYDKNLLDIISRSPRIFMELTEMLRKENQKFCAPGDTNEWRVTDRRLQALRKAGKIKFQGCYWTAVKS